MQSNNTSKNIFKIIMIFTAIMVFIPVGIIDSLEGFSNFLLIPIIMFSVFGLFVFNAVKNATKNGTVSKSPYNSASTDRHCTSCHQSIGQHFEYCPYCGEEQTDYVTCDYCGQQNSKDDLMCKNCNGLLK